jgi:Holliday junction resolvase RusA-like endonuclease
MSKLILQIPLEPISLNQSHRIARFGNRPTRIKTKDMISWEAEFAYLLSSANEQRKEFLANYDEKKHSFYIEIYFYIKEDKFITKKKTISQKSGDLSNMIKTSEDQVFRWLGIDDSQVTKIVVEKIPTKDSPQIVFMISLLGYPELFSVLPQSF